jgi:hypothetical protein
MKQRTYYLVVDALTEIAHGLRQEQRAAQKELEELDWGIKVCERHLGRFYEHRLVAEAVGDTMRTWIGLQP